jgi:hypothetical protein
METVKIKPSHESQGDHVVINKADFDPEKHELLVRDADAAPADAAPASGRPGRKPKVE